MEQTTTNQRTSPRESAQRPQFLNPYDYELKYTRDTFGEERAENARVWLTYLDEAEIWDRGKVNGWNDTVNGLLVFIGIFSAILATFLSILSQNLLIFELVQLNRAQLTGEPVSNIPSSVLTPNSPSPSASLVSGLWFSSLTISICAAMVAALVKRWLCAYTSPVSGTARERARVRQFRFECLEKWRVRLIIDLLPVFLHLALGLFLIGLIAFILRLHTQIVWFITTFSGIFMSSTWFHFCCQPGTLSVLIQPR